MLCIIIILLMNQKYSKENVDNIKSIIHNNNYNIEDYKSNRFILNQSYHKIVEEAEKRKRLAEYKERVDRLREERKAELEKKRLAKQKEEKKVVVSRSKSYDVDYEATFYTAYCSTGCTGVTASGYDVSNTIYYQGYRIVAMPPHIPFYTKLLITLEDGTLFKAIVLDRGGDIQRPNRIDILVSSKEEAYNLGRQTVKISTLN